MQKCNNPSSFLANSMGAPQGDESGCIVPDSNNSSRYFLICSYSQGLCLYIDFFMGSALSTSGILYTSPSFQLGKAREGNIPRNTS